MSNHYKHILIEEVQHIVAVNPYKPLAEWKKFDAFHEANPPIVWDGPAFDETKTDEEIEEFEQIYYSDSWIEVHNPDAYTQNEHRKAARPKEVEQVKLSDKIGHINCDPNVLKDPEFVKAINQMAELAYNKGKANQPVQQEGVDNPNHDPSYFAPIVSEGEQRKEKEYLIDKKTAYNIYVAGFNHGFNEHSVIPEHGTYEAFERLMNGESPCKDGTCYDIKKQSLSPNREQEESAGVDKQTEDYLSILKLEKDSIADRCTNLLNDNKDLFEILCKSGRYEDLVRFVFKLASLSERLTSISNSRLSSQEEKPLRELSEITEVDKIILLELQGYSPERIDEFKSKEFYFDKTHDLELSIGDADDNYETVNIKAYQYLQSRGYKMPKYY